MDIAVSHRSAPTPRRANSNIYCNANCIPLSYLKHLSGEAVRKLKEFEIESIEALHAFSKKDAYCRIGNRHLRQHILEVKEAIARRLHQSSIKSNELNSYLLHKNIRLSPAHRSSLIAVYTFAYLLRDIDVLLENLLSIGDPNLRFKEKKSLGKIYDLSLRVITKRAA